MDNQHLTIKDWISLDSWSAKLFEHGFPVELPVLGSWHCTDTNEMALCDRDLFAKYSTQSSELPMQLLVDSFDCIAFMPEESAVEWLPFWIAASFFEQRMVDDPKGLVQQWTEIALTRLMPTSFLMISVSVIEEFARQSVSQDFSPEFYEELEKYIAKQEKQGS